MNVLLDTCALLALANGELPADAADALELAPFAYTSIISPWETAIKFHKGKLKLPESPPDWFRNVSSRYRIIAINLDVETAFAAAKLPLLHNDPFDRIIIATALTRELTILTSDRTIPTYPGVRTLW